MTELPDYFHHSSKNPARLAADLLHHYSFELAGYSVVQQLEIWSEYYPVEWLPIAIIEALYQGRYKAFSVEQILNLWERRKQPVYHFNHEFERLVCSKLPHAMNGSAPDLDPPVLPLPKPSLSYRKMLLELPSIQAASKLDRLNEIPPFKLSLPRLEPTIPPEPVHSSSDRDFKEFKEGVVFGLSSGLAVRALKPRLRLELSQYYTPNWMCFLEADPAVIPGEP